MSRAPAQGTPAEATAEAPAEAIRVAPRRFSDARIRLFRTVERLAVLAGGRRLYRRTSLAPGRFRVRREVLEAPGLPEGLDGYRVAQLSDLHAGPFMGAGDLRHVVDEVLRRAPDLIAITGDLITRDWREALTVLDDLARLRAPDGVFAVFGNHDYKLRQEHRIAAAYAERGIRFLRNESVRLASGPCVVGLEDLEEGRVVDLAAARAGVRPGDVELVLCHNPLGARGLAREGCLAVLSGHTHGNQMNLPLLRRLGPEHPGQRLEHGPTTLVVSHGLGVVGFPLRVGAPAEVVELVLRVPRAGGSGDADAR